MIHESCLWQKYLHLLSPLKFGWIEYFQFFSWNFFINYRRRGDISCILKSILWDTNNWNAVSSSLKSPLDWLWRMNTCFYYILLSISPERHVFRQELRIRDLSSSSHLQASRYWIPKFIFVEKLMHSKEF